MSDPVLQVVPLGAQWPTIDPFLFCAHHDDAYPAGNDQLGPAASLAGRPLGQDFGEIDGWNMYHGEVVPGFPQHPHRGFETVTFVRHGLIDHADSLGAAARFGRGDVQWLTAGGGVVHSEMFPLLDRDGPNPLELFQIWLNLPARDKLVEPYFTMLWADDIPRLVVTDEQGRVTEVTVIAGALDGLEPPAPPPNSWAARPEADVAIWHLRVDPGAQWTLPPATGPDTVRTLYLFEGDELLVGDHPIGHDEGAVIRADEPVALTGGAVETEALILQGRPIGEPVARYGPFVMNDEAGIEQTFDDYRRTGFGGWPWPVDDPVHGPDRGRFARHADGRVEEITELTPG
jgi:redox-sensitive bicupin YhaK (pirin superfamily)